MRVDLELAILLQNAEDTQLLVQYKVFLGLNKNVCDSHDAVLESLLLQLLQELNGRHLVTRRLNRYLSKVARVVRSAGSTSCGVRHHARLRHLSGIFVLIVEESNVVVEDLEKAIDIVLVHILPMHAPIFGDLQDARGQDVLDRRLGLLNDVSQAVKHVVQAVGLALIRKHLVKENRQ